MILYNTTFFAEPAVADDLLHFLRHTYLAECNRHTPGCGRILRVEGDVQDRVAYAVHVELAGPDALSHHRANVQLPLLQKAADLWGQRVLALPTVLHSVD